MTQIIQEKDRLVSHLQNTNRELEDYMANLERLSSIDALGVQREATFFKPKQRENINKIFSQGLKLLFF